MLNEHFFDFFIIAVIGYAIVMILTGNGEKLMGRPGQGGARDRYDVEKFNRATLIMCVVLLINEILLLTIQKYVPVYMYISLAIVVIVFIIYFIYLKKYASKK